MDQKNYFCNEASVVRLPSYFQNATSSTPLDAFHSYCSTIVRREGGVEVQGVLQVAPTVAPPVLGSTATPAIVIQPLKVKFRLTA